MTAQQDCIEVRRGRLGDAPVIVEFNRRLALETENARLDRALLARGVRAVLERPDLGFYLVAVAGDRVVGQLMITYEWSDWRNGHIWWLQSVYVEEAFRRRGVFRRLYRRTEELASQAEQVVGLRLYVEKSNRGARETYERLGMSTSHYHVLEMMSLGRPASPGGQRSRGG